MNALLLTVLAGRYVILKPSRCWRWIGAHNLYDYGEVRVPGGLTGDRAGRPREMAHRVSYVAHIGPIPKGLHVLHRCDRPRCVNPAHLFLGTPGDNTKDKVRKNRQAQGERVAGAKLTRDDARAIRAAKHLPHGVLAEKYGVSKSTISYLLSGHTWRCA